MTANPGGGDYRPETRPTDAVAWVRVNLGAYRADRTLAVHRDGFWWTDVDCDDTGISGHRHDDPREVTVLEVLRPASGPVSVAQDATDATETPARTPGGSGTAEARTEAQGGEGELIGFHAQKAAGESATDPGMTNLEAELVALRAQVERLRTLADRIISVHEQVVMDTPEDRDLHARACATFRAALNAGERP